MSAARELFVESDWGLQDQLTRPGARAKHLENEASTRCRGVPGRPLGISWGTNPSTPEAPWAPRGWRGGSMGPTGAMGLPLRSPGQNSWAPVSWAPKCRQIESQGWGTEVAQGTLGPRGEPLAQQYVVPC